MESLVCNSIVIRFLGGHTHLPWAEIAIRFPITFAPS